MKNNSLKKLIIIGSDFSLNSGEGILGNNFIKLYFSINTKVKFKKKSFFFNLHNRNGFLHKYLGPIIMSLYVRFNPKSRFIFVNYLPLWNFLIFLILPKHTIIGPVTGSNIVKENSFLNIIVRKFFFPIFYKISLNIIYGKFKKVIFSTSLLKNNIKVTNHKILFNYVLNCFNFKKKNKLKTSKKKYDLIFYFRKHKNKYDKNLHKIIKNISLTKKIAVMGDKFISPSKNIFNFGYINRIKAKKLMRASKFAICGPENLYSLFAIDGYNSGCNLIVEKKLKNYEFAKSKRFIFYEYKYSNKNILILKKLINKFSLRNDLEFEKKVIKKKEEIKKFIKF